MRQEIRVIARGGLGNQLFQFAAAVNLANKINKPIVVDNVLLISDLTNQPVSARKLELDTFENSAKFEYRKRSVKTSVLLRLYWLQRIIGNKFPRFMIFFGVFANEDNDNYKVFSKLSKPVTINSYCSRPVFFAETVTQIIENVSSIKNTSKEFEFWLQEIKARQPIAMHLRLGDYKNLEQIYGKPDINYYKKSLEILKLNLNIKEIWVFSDEPELAKKFFAENIDVDEYIPNSEALKPIEYLNLLGNCAGLVCSNSSFSWWAAFLADYKNNAPIVFPRPMFDDPKLREPFNWLPESWMTMGRAVTKNV